MDLAQWQDRLKQHFEKLHVERTSCGRDRPIFALEHGLDDNDRKALDAAILKHIEGSAPSDKHMLPWVVYAAEFGYRFLGDEYWQTFEGQTPGWGTHGDRDWIRKAFRKFQTEFGGAKPSGPWAENFSIICWPITHAILPQDLQQQLAMILSELRDSFSVELFESPSKLGELIHRRSWNATSRFQNLAQETQLVGQIAAALLLQGEYGTDGLILPETLRRIGEDLDHQQQAREWLRRARSCAKTRASVRGLATGTGSMSTGARRPEDAREQVFDLGIEPRLVLRPISVPGKSWEVTLEIPDLSHLLVIPWAQEILTGSRCFVAGSSGVPLARGWFLYGARRLVLAQWPRSDEVLLRFEPSNPKFDNLLRVECLLRPEFTHLFHVESDGLAYEMRSMRVRPKERYVLVSTSGILEANAYASPVALSCEGVKGVIIELPDALDEGWQEALQTLGLEQARTIEVWPAGLAAVGWDGEGHAEWLPSECPCLAIRADYQIDALFVSMDGSAEDALEIAPVKPGEPVFVEIPGLPVGLHRLQVGVRCGPEAETEQIGDLDLKMRIREARPQEPGVSPHGPLLVQVDPPAPTIEQLWEGSATITVRGPEGRKMRCRAELFEKDEGAPTVKKTLPPIALPVTAEDWRAVFETQFRDAKDVQSAYDTARVCKLEFSADELGAFTVRCEREFTPLRWALRRRGQGHFLRLIDDSGREKPPEVKQLAFEEPLVEKRLDLAPEYEIPAAGGLYVGRTEAFTAAVIVPPIPRDLAHLKCTPHIDVGAKSVESIARLLYYARLWGHARLPGNVLSLTRQREVLRSLARQIFLLLCGPNWSKAEDDVVGEGGGIPNLRLAVSKRREESAVIAALPLDCATLATANRQECVKLLASIGRRFLSLPATPRESIRHGATILRRSEPNVDDPVWLAEFALRLASDICGVDQWAGENFSAGLSRLLNNPMLARAARFLVIAKDQHLQSRVKSGELYAGWGWTL